MNKTGAKMRSVGRKPGARKGGRAARASTTRVHAVGGKRDRSGGKAGVGGKIAGGKGFLNRTFPGLKASDGCGVRLTVGERFEGQWDEATETREVKMAVKTPGGGGAVGGLKRTLPGLCRALAAVGHVQRARIMAKLLEGPVTYRGLRQVTKLKAGPLYHHINQLRLAGLILPKQRDLYELTRGGRNLILDVMVVGPLIRDRRRRPVGGGT